MKKVARASGARRRPQNLSFRPHHLHPPWSNPRLLRQFLQLSKRRKRDRHVLLGQVITDQLDGQVTFVEVDVGDRFVHDWGIDAVDVAAAGLFDSVGECGELLMPSALILFICGANHAAGQEFEPQMGADDRRLGRWMSLLGVGLVRVVGWAGS